VCYTDSTIALPLLTAYLMARVKPRRLKRLYLQREAILESVRSRYLKTGTVSKVLTSRKIAKRSSSVGLKA
jgi:deoxyhypusine synthase